MTHAKIKIDIPQPFLDHTQLPDEDGTFVKNFQEHPQSILLTDSIAPILQQRHPDGNYAIGQDSGIYWRQTEPPQKDAEAPDWFYVPNVPPLLNGEFRRSYCLWQEKIAPLIAIEFASGDGTEELDKTPLSVSEDAETTKPGKFWVYEQIIEIAYYGIYIVKTGNLEMYYLEDNSYRQMSPNERGHYFIEPLGIELGKWQGSYQNQTLSWLRWWDSEGNLLLTGAEGKEIEKARGDRLAKQLEQERQRAEQERQRAEQAEQGRRNAIPQLLATGMSVEQVAKILSLTVEEVRKISGY
ncbi:MAG: Uma2 family endonuclease [Okeania sp. SIO3B5]|uniref:Uma2 family endonuclease n=1 Tax=Okeania sp. SIO3B5 TaxID=2607811 RepID=UPI0013FFD3F6|nr:Uma2 family endonuclease [Okeania sp. SIO3B5]NEO56585.1 Uma2 family endonuclease [Okeania sp. SIO3B5]